MDSARLLTPSKRAIFILSATDGRYKGGQMSKSGMAGIAVAVLAMTGEGITQEIAAPLPKFGADLCSSYLDKTAAQRKNAVIAEANAIYKGQPGRAASRRCIAAVVEDLRDTIVFQCLDGELTAEAIALWEDRVTEGIEQCRPGARVEPEPEPDEEEPTEPAPS
jgi:hypothetical protein